MSIWNSTSPNSKRKAEHKAALKSGKKKLRKCSVVGCKLPAVSGTALKVWCSTEHGAIIAEQLLGKKKVKEAKVERAQDRKRKDALKTRADYMKDAQKAFNAFRREWCRVNGFHLCPCCDQPLDWTGNNVDAGHYRSVGSAPHMRFTENNVWAQRKQCNRYGAGRAVDYRIGLIKRIGLEAVEAIESDQTPRKWTIPELMEITKTYRMKFREMLAMDKGVA